MADWFYRTKAGEKGPLRPSDLMNLARQGVINPETPLRRSDDDKWVAAKKLKGLFPSAVEVPPSRPVVQRSTKKLAFIAAGVCGLVLSIGGIVAMMKADKPTESASLAETPKAQDGDRTSVPSTQPETPATVAGTKDAQSDLMKQLETTRTSAVDVVKAYLAAKTWEERLPLMANIDAPPSRDSPLAPPAAYRPGTITASAATKDGDVENCWVEVNVSESHPDQPKQVFHLVQTSNGYKINAAVMERVAAQARMNATLAEIRDSKPSVEVTVLKMEKSVSSIRLDVRTTNNSTLHLGYVGFNLSYFDSEGGFVGTSLRNAVNLRAGASTTDQAILSGEHSLEEIARIKVSDLQLTTKTSTGAAINAAQFFTVNLKLDGNRAEDQTQLERTFRGQWLNDSGESKTRQYFSPDARTMHIGETRAGRFSTEITLRNYSTGEFGLRMFHPDGTGIGGVYRPIQKGVFRMTRGQLRPPGNLNWSPPDDDPTKGPVQTYIDAREVP